MQPLEEDIGCGDLTDGRHRVRLDSFASAEAGIAERELARLALVGGDAQPDRPVQTPFRHREDRRSVLPVGSTPVACPQNCGAVKAGWRGEPRVLWHGMRTATTQHTN